jgi:hypothetical protein
MDRATSSPLTDLPTSSTAFAGTQSSLRRTKELPHEVIQNLQSYYEEDLNAQGFDFLYALAANSATPTEVLAPPISHLTLAATICVHPNTTTRTADPTKQAQSSAAFRLLQLLQRLAGPNIPWKQAFHFRKYDFFHPKVKDVYQTFESKHNYDTSGLYTRAEDFWAIVGWAFNCACLKDMYAARWTYYQPFLSLMLDIIEADFFQRPEDTLDESVLWSYIELASGGHGRSRRIIRAIFADGTSKTLNEFHEIFNKELHEHKKQEEKSTVKVSIDDDEFGKYGGSSDMSEDDTRTTKRVRTRTRTPSGRASAESLRDDYTTTSTTLGPPSALRLRARLIRLLAEVVNHPSLFAHSPSTFVDRDELYTLYVEFIKPLPLPIFQEFILPNTYTGAAFDALTHTRLCEAILRRTLESRAPATAEAGLLTAERLIQCYLPYGASSSGIDAQARVALLVEALTRRAELDADVEMLRWATEEGVRRREDYAREAMGRRKKHDENALKALKESGTRLRALVSNM